MRISREEVEQIAALARLRLQEDEIEVIARDLGSILEHMKELGEVELAEVAPMGGVSEHAAPMREDEPRPDALHLPLGRLAPALTEGFFTVPRLAALDADALRLAEEAGP
jgi:aspartyl-tRNA(Asn)/glutamyl-tRNA(Gln) amidotransferase subunit C